MWTTRVVKVGSELILGAHCPGCAGTGFGVCAGCRATIAATRPVLVDGLPSGLPPVVTAGRYEAELRRLLLAAKERNALGAVPVLGRRLAAAAALLILDQPAIAAGPVVLVPVPSARAVVAQRGLDLTGTLARMAAGELRRAGLTVQVSATLRLVRRPEDQAGLSREQRLANLAGAFRATPVAPPGALILVDDIVTTGATLVEATRALAALNPPRGAATIAATPRHHPPSPSPSPTPPRATHLD